MSLVWSIGAIIVSMRNENETLGKLTVSRVHGLPIIS